MRNIVSLTNTGLIPMDAVTTMGVSAKGGENPIGFFGTGLKYAIAGLLRTSHKITIFCGLDRYDFSVSSSNIRGKDFDIVVMTGPEGPIKLGFTTHLGAKWEPWQIFRELYSNCLDEAGTMSFSAAEPEDGKTTIRVSGAAFSEAARKKADYFLTGDPIYSGSLVDIYGGGSGGIFYRGVRVNNLPFPSLHTYNITHEMDLTEDRTLKSPSQADNYVAYTIAQCTKPGVISTAVTAGRFHYEGNLPYHSPSDVFAETVLEICEMQGIASVSPHAQKLAEQWAQREARVKPSHLSPREAAEIEDAKAFLARMGYEITAPITVTETLGAGVFGMAKDGKIFLSKLTLARGGNFLIGTLLEEQLHLTHGFIDESRRFQDFLIDMIVKFSKDAEFNRVSA